MKPRSFITIDDLSDEEIISLFHIADEIMAEMGVEESPRRIRGRTSFADKHVLATLFFEPSTRTRLSFESAMLRAGGHVISTPDAGMSSASKGESIADTARVAQSYCDAIVIRDKWEGTARVAADFCNVPVINAGDGSHEHPTQTLCDLYTLWVSRKRLALTSKNENELKFLKGVNVVLHGDLKFGRTVHSLVYGLARFGAQIRPNPATGCDLPPHVQRRLREYYALPFRSNGKSDVVYYVPESAHQLALVDTWDISMHHISAETRQALSRKMIDVYYSTRLQVERLPESERENFKHGYPTISKQLLKGARYRNTKIMHPLPRVDEISYEIDEDERGIYFQQAAYGVPVRMALLAMLLKLKPGISEEASEIASKYPLYTPIAGLSCRNEKCVTNKESERRYLKPNFWIVNGLPMMARCRYCDHEIQLAAVAYRGTKKYATIDREFVNNSEEWKKAIDNLVFFHLIQDAQDAGYALRKGRSRANVATRKRKGGTLRSSSELLTRAKRG